MRAHIRALLDRAQNKTIDRTLADYRKKKSIIKHGSTEAAREANVERMRQRAETNRSKGKCACGKPRIPERKYCQKCKDSSLAYQAEIKRQVMNRYGGKCACCGEDNLWFLNIDHIHNDGKLEERRHRGGIGLYRKIQREGYPKGRYRVLCYNCNIGRYRNGGICPHKTESN